jgi:hypothetical protein
MREQRMKLRDNVNAVDERSFDDLCDAALATGEIVGAASRADLNNVYLKRELLDKSVELSAVSHSLVVLHGQAVNAVNETKLLAAKHAGAVRPLVATGIITVICALPVALRLTYMVSHGGLHWPTDVWEAIRRYDMLYIATGVAVIAFIVALSNYIKQRAIWRIRRNNSDKERELQELAAIEEQIEQEVLQKKILPELRALLNAAIKPTFAQDLVGIEPRGLSQVFDPRYEIPTHAKERLERLLTSMPGGTIGISGPRGAGKTTLLSSLSDHRSPGATAKQVLSIVVSAPVEYSARDFILHLFGTLCHRTLEIDRGDKTVGQRATGNPREAFLYGTTFSQFYSVTNLVGVMILMLGLMLVFGRFAESVGQSSNTTTATSPTASVSTPATSATGQGKSDNGTVAGPTTAITNALGLSPGTVMILGISIIFAGIILRNRDHQHMWRLGLAPDVDYEPTEPIAKMAKKYLDGIRFQQSYSSGWSGSLKLPIGLEGGVNAVASLSRQQRSLPEIVEDFRTFVIAATQQYKVLIGIDELDKIASDEAAQRFLNEIKSVFGIDRCFYVISVSEGAMSSFERRGIAFRDAFDSSLDALIYADYLNLNDAALLLRRRIVGMPMPFLWLSYCLSGGLPRDLIRTCRDILELSQESGQRNLVQIMEALIERDFQTRARAVAMKATELQCEPAFTELVHQLLLAVNQGRSANSLTTTVGGLLDICAQLDQSKEADSNRREAINRAVDLSFNFAVYIYYLSTVSEIFQIRLDEIARQEVQLPPIFDDLTVGRKNMATSAHSAIVLLNDFRARHNLDAVVPAMEYVCRTRELVDVGRGRILVC